MLCLRYSIILTFVSCSISILSFEISDDDYHKCARSCSDETTLKKKCVYHFFVAEAHDVTSFCDKFDKDDISACSNVTMDRSLLTINGKSPGPAIQICLGDTIEVLVYNKLGSDELTFHWHGIRQKDSNHMDGVPMITQCPILPFSGFRYKIHPDRAGTYFYHAHSVGGPRDDPSLERILLLSSRPSSPLTRQSRLHPPTPDGLLVNGQARQVVVQVKHGLRYLLRLVNANAHNCPILLSVDEHSLRILAADGNPVQSMTGTHVVLFPGERLDCILTADQVIGKYPLNIQGLQDCRNSSHEAHVIYEDAELASYTMKSTVDRLDEREMKIAESGHHCYRLSRNVICSSDLKSAEQSGSEEKADETIYVPFDTNAFSFFTDEMTDNSYNFYTSRYYPAYLSLRKDGIKIPQINGMSFKYPSSPILSQPENTPKKFICSIEERSSECADTPLFCECVQLMEVAPRKTIEIILIDEGFGGNASHTFHVHGYNAELTGRGSFDRPISKDKIVSLDRDGKIQRNAKNAVRKDTFVVPNKGYIIVRFYSDNLGYWLWEARSTGIYPQALGPAMQFLMKVGLDRNTPLVPIDFPSCGSNKGIDLIFESS